MEIIKVVNPQMGGKKAFELFKASIESGAETIGLATGSTPITFYEAVINSDIDLSHVTSVNLDEYVGLSRDNKQSYAYFMNEQLFKYKKLKASFLPNGLAIDIYEEISRYNDILTRHPIDFQILGVGSNGHIGFNEPGTSFESTTHLVNLAPSTIEANARFFDTIDEVPTEAISMGIANIMAAKCIVLMAYGESKAEAIYNTVHGSVTEQVPASILQRHPNVTIIVDEAAGKLI
ncbi:glucosamine-6-phosphate deaminase [Macrococcoides canis]|uniref:Glucosamine-6-phosphate deaminase n=1 Tax=Macrococcoides canis TaxID=1855823 RepID=A0AAE6X2Y9_9STAP|nr:glucosamine-6-phosphate deaminase [Macrococcus canis]QCT75396.1 glucosamine-6-phosphate deaminase [Macrococcus canis]QIH76613.1 glucosamine-6-phosphate deaminase [Macrococcus canis]QIH79029.1 glucosamine-6-phosphate deaminase [Macrococcus canis]QNR08563.1 glucosamine-6-phosphate deaminase [Macrococcus canis]